jgi:hypothetical protein
MRPDTRANQRAFAPFPRIIPSQNAGDSARDGTDARAFGGVADFAAARVGILRITAAQQQRSRKAGQ